MRFTSHLGEGKGVPIGSSPGLSAGLLFIAYLLGAGIAQLFAVMPESGISIWPPGGLLLGSLLLADRRGWPWLVTAALVADLMANALWFHNPMPVALGLFAANLAGAMAGVGLMRLGGPLVPFETVAQVARLAVLGAGVAPAVSATLGAAILDAAGIQDFAMAWPLWWLRCATAACLTR